jgi:protein-S-isoprenylcysteine O-methyltransferase Ste14
MRHCRPVLAASIGLTALGAALWVLVAVEIWVDTDMVAPRHEGCLTITAATVAIIAAICWSTWARRRAEHQRDQVLIKTLAAFAPRQPPAPGQRALHAVRPR